MEQEWREGGRNGGNPWVGWLGERVECGSDIRPVGLLAQILVTP